jgi:hypothetical protein
MRVAAPNVPTLAIEVEDVLPEVVAQFADVQIPHGFAAHPSNISVKSDSVGNAGSFCGNPVAGG